MVALSISARGPRPLIRRDCECNMAKGFNGHIFAILKQSHIQPEPLTSLHDRTIGSAGKQTIFVGIRA